MHSSLHVKYPPKIKSIPRRRPVCLAPRPAMASGLVLLALDPFWEEAGVSARHCRPSGPAGGWAGSGAGVQPSRPAGPTLPRAEEQGVLACEVSGCSWSDEGSGAGGEVSSYCHRSQKKRLQRRFSELICRAGTAENNQENQDAEMMAITAVPA